MTTTIVCLGDSITRGQVSANYIDVLAERLSPLDVRLVNAGVNNDLTDNVLRRVPAAAAENPDIVTVLVGTNDVIASLSYRNALFYILNRRLYRWPVLTEGLRNLAKVVRRLKATTHAAIGVASIPVLGEALNGREMQAVRRYNAGVRQIVEAEGAAYLPVFEHMDAFLRENGRVDGLPYNHQSPRETMKLMARRVLLREDFDEFSAREGYLLLTDSVHLNCKGADLVADAMESFLRAHIPTPVESEPVILHL